MKRISHLICFILMFNVTSGAFAQTNQDKTVSEINNMINKFRLYPSVNGNPPMWVVLDEAGNVKNTGDVAWDSSTAEGKQKVAEYLWSIKEKVKSMPTGENKTKIDKDLAGYLKKMEESEKLYSQYPNSCPMVPTFKEEISKQAKETAEQMIQKIKDKQEGRMACEDETRLAFNLNEVSNFIKYSTPDDIPPTTTGGGDPTGTKGGGDPTGTMGGGDPTGQQGGGDPTGQQGGGDPTGQQGGGDPTGQQGGGDEEKEKSDPNDKTCKNPAIKTKYAKFCDLSESQQDLIKKFKIVEGVFTGAEETIKGITQALQSGKCKGEEQKIILSALQSTAKNLSNIPNPYVQIASAIVGFASSITNMLIDIVRTSKENKLMDILNGEGGSSYQDFLKDLDKLSACHSWFLLRDNVCAETANRGPTGQKISGDQTDDPISSVFSSDDQKQDDFITQMLSILDKSATKYDKSITQNIVDQVKAADTDHTERDNMLLNLMDNSKKYLKQELKDKFRIFVKAMYPGGEMKGEPVFNSKESLWKYDIKCENQSGHAKKEKNKKSATERALEEGVESEGCTDKSVTSGGKVDTNTTNKLAGLIDLCSNGYAIINAADANQQDKKIKSYELSLKNDFDLDYKKYCDNLNACLISLKDTLGKSSLTSDLLLSKQIVTSLNYTFKGKTSQNICSGLSDAWVSKTTSAHIDVARALLNKFQFDGNGSCGLNNEIVKNVKDKFYNSKEMFLKDGPPKTENKDVEGQ